MQKKTVHFIVPYNPIATSLLDSSAVVTSYAYFNPLGVLQLAALTPTRFEVRVTDEFFGRIEPERDDSDIIALSFSTPNARRAFELADRYRKLGKTVVGGGVHPTANSDEAAEHLDIVVRGEAEEIWAGLLEDIEHNRAAPLYKAERYPDLTGVPAPRRDLLDFARYSRFSTVQTSRGCPFGCDFCCVSNFFGKKIRITPIGKSIEQIKQIQALRGTDGPTYLLFADENITFKRDYALELFKAMKPLNVRWVAQGNLKNFVDDDELIRAARDAGCFLFLFGFESVNPRLIAHYRKSYSEVSELQRAIRQLHKSCIAVVGSFIFGHDEDVVETFDDTFDFALESEIDIFLPQIMTPYPGTAQFARLDAEKRITSKDWNRYTLDDVVFEPKNMSPEELRAGWRRLYRQFYTIGSISKRLVRFARFMHQSPHPFETDLIATMLILNTVYLKMAYTRG